MNTLDKQYFVEWAEQDSVHSYDLDQQRFAIYKKLHSEVRTESKQPKYRLEQDDFGTYIVALRDFSDVSAGEKGGYVHGEHNLSHYGDCWIYHKAIVCENARVEENARVCDTAVVAGNSLVTENSVVEGDSFVHDSVVRGESFVTDSVLKFFAVVVNSVVKDSRLKGLALYDECIIENATAAYDLIRSKLNRSQFRSLNFRHVVYEISSGLLCINDDIRTIYEWLKIFDYYCNAHNLDKNERKNLKKIFQNYAALMYSEKNLAL
jgi:hypothetical protein